MKKISARIQPSILTSSLSRTPKISSPPSPDPTETLCKILSSTPSSAIDTALDHSGIRPTPEVVHSVLSRFRNAGLLAYRFYRWSSSSGAHTVRAHHAVIESLAKIRQFELVWEVVGSMKSEGVLNVETFCVIMRKYARARKVDEALYCFNSMEKHGVAQNQAAFDGLLSALCKSGNVRKAQEVFDSLRDRFDPGPKSYSILMEGWGREPNLPRAREVFREMVDRKISPDAVTFGIMVDLLCKSGRTDEAAGIISAMPSPSSYVYTVLIHAHGREGRIEEAEAAFLGIAEPDAAAYNAMAGAYVRGGMTDAAYRTVREMASRGIGPTARTMNVVIGGLIGREEFEEAAAAFRKMSRRCDPDADTYTMMIKMLCGRGQVEGAVGMWRYMKRRGFVPSMHTFSVLIDGLCREGDAERACVLAEEMIENGLRPVGVTFRRLEQLLVKQGRDDALQFLRQKMDLLVKEPLLD